MFSRTLLGAAKAALLSGAAATAALLPGALLAEAAPADRGARAADDRDTIVVTASPFATFSDNTPTIVAKVDRNTILTAGGGSIADSLAAIPGISATSFASGASRPIVRGMDANRVRLLEDGASSSDVSDIGPDHGIPMDPMSAQSIEVVRGPATLRYGSQAIGGVVNLLNNRVPTKLPNQPFSAELDGAYGTVAKSGEISGMADAKLGDFAVHADGFKRTTSDYDTPLGRQANSYFDGQGGSIGGSYFAGNSHFGAALIRYDADYGVPSDITHIVMRQTKAITKDSIDLGGGQFKSLDLTGSYADYRHREIFPDGTIGSTFLNKEYDARAELLIDALGPIANSAVGVEYQRRRFSALGDGGNYLSPTLTRSIAAYAFAEMPVTTALRLQASGRIEHVGVRGTPASDVPTKVDYTPVSGSIGALFDAGRSVKLGLTFSSTGRAPAQTELFARGGHDGPQTFEIGDPRLKLERSNSLEATLRVRSGGLHFDGSLYSSWFHNYIYGDLTGRTCDDDGTCAANDDGELRELFYRQRGAHFYGAEAEATYEVIKTGRGTLAAKVLADYTRATLSGGGNVPRIPPYRVGGGFNWTSKPVDAGVLLLYVGRQTKFGDFDTPTPGYKQLNAQIAWRPFKQWQGVELAIVGQNLTNDVQRAATALNKDLVVLPGRNVRLVLRVATF